MTYETSIILLISLVVLAAVGMLATLAYATREVRDDDEDDYQYELGALGKFKE